MSTNLSKFKEKIFLPFDSYVLRDVQLTKSIDFSIIYKICVKQLTSFVRTVQTASDAKICTILNSA